MTILLVTSDLATGSRIDGAARRVGVTLQTVSGPQQAVASCTEQSAALVLVDLSTPALDVGALAAELKALNPAPRIVAFGPHVHESLLAAAHEAGCDEALSRGQFFGQLDAVLQRALPSDA